MLKKSLIAIAVLAIALPAVAGDIKVHVPWPKAYVPQAITTIDVILDVGFFIHVKDQDPIQVHQVSTADNPFTTYAGCRTTDVISNFDAKLFGKVKSTSDAGGDWSATFDSSDEMHVHPGTTAVEICVRGVKVKIEKLVGGAKDVKVAELTIWVLPAS
ncbi:MAG: hypothetical protein IIA65_03190 [Planctomycetes bacterium]|nr:hypothetical protein [Planctomycetota bacterium]